MSRKGTGNRWKEARTKAEGPRQAPDAKANLTGIVTVRLRPRKGHIQRDNGWAVMTKGQAKQGRELDKLRSQIVDTGVWLDQGVSWERNVLALWGSSSEQ